VAVHAYNGGGFDEEFVMKRLIACVLGLVAALAVCASAQEGPHVVEAAPRVMVFPFAPIGNPGSYEWIGTGIQQSLLVEVNRPGSIAWTVPVSAPATQPIANPVADAARSGATIAVFGNFQIIDDEIRVTGQTIDTGNGQVLVALKATGPIHDLFKVEDQLDVQLQQALPHEPRYPLNTAVEVQESAPVPAVAENDVQVVEPTYVVPDTYGYGIPYPYYSDFGAFYGPGIVFGGRGFFDHRGFHGDHHFFPAPIGRGFGGGFGFGGLRTGVGVAHGGGFEGGFHGGGFGGLHR
jgi:TolB-like protein